MEFGKSDDSVTKELESVVEMIDNSKVSKKNRGKNLDLSAKLFGMKIMVLCTAGLTAAIDAGSRRIEKAIKKHMDMSVGRLNDITNGLADLEAELNHIDLSVRDVAGMKPKGTGARKGKL